MSWERQRRDYVVVRPRGRGRRLGLPSAQLPPESPIRCVAPPYSRSMALMTDPVALGKKLLTVGAGLGLALVPLVLASSPASARPPASGGTAASASGRSVAFWGT